MRRGAPLSPDWPRLHPLHPPLHPLLRPLHPPLQVKPESGAAELSGGLFANNTEPSLQMAAVPAPVFQHNATVRLGGSLVATPTEASVAAAGTTLGDRSCTGVG